MTDLVRLEELGPAQRVERYLDRLEKSRQHDPEDIHGFDVGEPSEAILKAADLRALIQLLKDREGALTDLLPCVEQYLASGDDAAMSLKAERWGSVVVRARQTLNTGASS